jgi:hypothetical protein
VAEQADKLRVAQLERNKRRKRWRSWLGAPQISDVRVNEAGTVLPDLSFGPR